MSTRCVIVDRLETPIGDVTIGVDQDQNLVSLDFIEAGRADCFSLDRFYPDRARRDGRAPESIKQALRDYFDGDIDALTGLPVSLPGTAFQRDVWSALCAIQLGTTCSYLDIANAIGNPKAVRAVGMANNANPIAIVVPCHRVIGADGSMVGYGSGIKRKQWLLRHEGVYPAQGELAI